MSSEKNAQTFFEFAAQSDVEFGKLDVADENGNLVSVVTTSGDEKGTATLPSLVRAFSKAGYTGIKQTHSHPDGNSVPSGHYDDKNPKNPYSLTPLPLNHPGHKKGDAQNARWTKSQPGFAKTQFKVYNPKTKKNTSYDGVYRAEID